MDARSGRDAEPRPVLYAGTRQDQASRLPVANRNLAVSSQAVIYHCLVMQLGAKDEPRFLDNMWPGPDQSPSRFVLAVHGDSRQRSADRPAKSDLHHARIPCHWPGLLLRGQVLGHWRRQWRGINVNIVDGHAAEHLPTETLRPPPRISNENVHRRLRQWMVRADQLHSEGVEVE